MERHHWQIGKEYTDFRTQGEIFGKVANGDHVKKELLPGSPRSLARAPSVV